MRQFEGGAIACLLEEGSFAKYRAKLFWPLIAGDFSSERL
jgi:hypothetical protein